MELELEGDVRFDDAARTVYSVDASIYEIKPRGIVLPKSQQDIVHTVKTAREEKIPLTARGAATGITGGCLGEGLIVDTSRYLNQILEVNLQEEYALCQPGVIQDDLNRALAKEGYRLGPSTSTGNRATIGGMVANNAAGAHSLLYGQTADHILELEMVLPSGKTEEFREMSLEAWKEQCLASPLYKKLWDIRKTYGEEILNHFPKIHRMVSGYHLPSLIEKETFNPCRLIAGSEGTLGIVTKIKLKIVPVLKATKLYVLHFSDMISGIQAVASLLEMDPLAIEMIDREILESGKRSLTIAGRLGWLQGDPACVLVVEMSRQQSFDHLDAYSVTEPALPQRDDIWAVRKAGLELLLSKRAYKRAIAFIEDVAVPTKHLPEFVREFQKYLKQTNRTAGIYGHAGAGCLHIRPFINLREEGDLKLMETMTRDVSDMVLRFEGAMSGEHGDGLVRSWLNKKMFTPPLYQAFCEVKAAFDPENLMNPGKVVEGQPFLKNLRSSPQDQIHAMTTFQDFSQEGGFELAVDMCNGNGLCRKKESVMCPSFQATGFEYETTRARAQILRSVILGKLKPESLSHPAVQDVLDLCLQCKGCKKECPSQVDMAKMKTEALYQHGLKQGIPIRNRLFGHIGTLNQWGSLFPRLTNWFSESVLMRSLLKHWGITSKRPLPKLAEKRFSHWLKSYPQPQEAAETVVLFNDTYTEFHEPDIGKDAIKTLNALNIRVVVPKWSCCGRPLVSKGLLPEAKTHAEALIQSLLPYAEKKIPILFLEPSCLSMVTDDMLSLANETQSRAIAESCQSIETFIAGRLNDKSLQKLKGKIQFHGHCHQKSLWGVDDSLKVLSALSESPVEDIAAGCCGMAGSFGYEHYDLSMKIGELKLFPTVRAGEAHVVANGFSCRKQIEHGTGKKAFHIIELIRKSYCGPSHRQTKW